MAVVAAMVLMFASCREVQPYEPESPPVNGYELQGRVTSANGVAIESVAVSLDYSFDKISDQSLDTIPFVEPNPPRTIGVYAYDYLGHQVRQIFLGTKPPGPVTGVNWSGIDDHGQPVPSGKYTVEYSFPLDNIVVKRVPVLIRRTVTAYTDRNGNFTIQNHNLPIGENFDIYDYRVAPPFLGAYHISETVYLLFQRSTLSRSATASLQVNNVYHGAYTLE